MLLRSGKLTSSPGSHHNGSRRGSGGSTCGLAGHLHRRTKKSSGEASSCSLDDRHRLLKRSSFSEDEAAPPHQVKRKSPHISSPKQLMVELPSPWFVTWVHQALPEAVVLDNVDDSFNETSVEELGMKMYPNLPPNAADATMRYFLDNAKACIKHYNLKYQADFVYKHVFGFGLILVQEGNGKHCFHLNFYAQDKKGHTQLFFGEIRVRVAPKEDDVSCCLPVSPSDADGKSIRTIKDLLEHEFPNLGTAGVDTEHCYACPSAVKHPKGTCYVAGHVADSRHYFVPDD